MSFRIAAAQISPVVGDFEGNAGRIVECAKRAAAARADLMVSCAMALTGNPLRGLVARRDFCAAAQKALPMLVERLQAEGCRVPVVVGTTRIEAEGAENTLPRAETGADGDAIYPGSKAVLIESPGEGRGTTQPEIVARAGEPFRTVTVGGRPIAIGAGLECRPSPADALVLMFSTRFAVGRAAARETVLSSIAAGTMKPVVWVNQVGGNDETIFEGRSAAFDATGRLTARGKAFAEDLFVVDTDEGRGEVSPGMSSEEELFEALVLGVRDYVTRSGLKGGIVGLSGGVDSALVACIAVSALGPERVLGVGLPGPYNQPESLRDARMLAETLGIRFVTVPIAGAFDNVKSVLGSAGESPLGDLPEQNMQSRLRGVMLMALSNKYGLALLNTGNKSEGAMGYCTLYGDSCGAVAVIGDIVKEQVYSLSRHFNARSGRQVIPEYTLVRAPSAELRPGQKDSDSLPEYPILDPILNAYLEEGKSPGEIAASGFERQVVDRVIRGIDAAEFKRRQCPFALRVSAHGYGQARNIPLIHRFRG